MSQPQSPVSALQPVSDPALEARVQAAIAEVRPMLQRDGGDIVYLGLGLGLDGLLVRVQMVGACRSCPSQSVTLKVGVESQVRERVPEVAGLQLEQGAVPERRAGQWNIY